VNDPGLVRSLERVGDLERHVQDLRTWKRLAGDHVFESLSFQQLHHDEGLALELVNFVDRTNVGVIEAGGSPRFALESLQRLRIPHQFRWQEFQSDAST